MNYAKLYIDVYSHPKFIAAGFEASGYWMHALAYLRHQESSNGLLAESVITVPLNARKARCKRLCEKLVSVGLFRKVDGGYVLLRYAERNETREDIVKAKAALRERKSKSRRPKEGPDAHDTVSESPSSSSSLPPGEESVSRTPPNGTLLGRARGSASKPRRLPQSGTESTRRRG